MAKKISLPRESNPVRSRSIFLRSMAKLRTARAAYRANPNVGTMARYADRILAARAQSRRCAFVRAYNRTDIHGAARSAHVRTAARRYREALRAWAAGYDVTSGWSATARLAN